MAAFEKISSGIPSMDSALDHIRLGDDLQVVQAVQKSHVRPGDVFARLGHLQVRHHALCTELLDNKIIG